MILGFLVDTVVYNSVPVQSFLSVRSRDNQVLLCSVEMVGSCVVVVFVVTVLPSLVRSYIVWSLRSGGRKGSCPPWNPSFSLLFCKLSFLLGLDVIFKS